MQAGFECICCSSTYPLDDAEGVWPVLEMNGAFLMAPAGMMDAMPDLKNQWVGDIIVCLGCSDALGFEATNNAVLLWFRNTYSNA